MGSHAFSGISQGTGMINPVKRETEEGNRELITNIQRANRWKINEGCFFMDLEQRILRGEIFRVVDLDSV